jgi:hypothetical protein
MIATRALLLLLLRHGHAWVAPSLRPAPAVGRRAAATVSETAAAATPPASALTWDNDAWKAGYTTARAELSECIEVPDLPADLRGTYYRNGPGQFEVRRGRGG